eukprot:scaffold82729_cov14-Tisochrysis_lutea.AAC.1
MSNFHVSRLLYANDFNLCLTATSPNDPRVCTAGRLCFTGCISNSQYPKNQRPSVSTLEQTITTLGIWQQYPAIFRHFQRPGDVRWPRISTCTFPLKKLFSLVRQA